MIIARGPFADFLSHTLMLLLLAIYVRTVLDMKSMNFLYVAIGIAAFVTFVNWMYFPGLRLVQPNFVDYGAARRPGFFMCPICRYKHKFE
jgi:hypothetical protein